MASKGWLDLSRLCFLSKENLETHSLSILIEILLV